MGLLQMMRAVRARRAIVISVALFCVVLALSVSLPHEKSYCATASLVLQPKGGDLHEDWSFSQQTQIELMRSQYVALIVVDALALTASPSFQEGYNDAAYGGESMRDWIAARLLRSFEVRPLPDSGIVNLRFSAANANFAAQVANAFAHAYLQAGAALPLNQFTDAAFLNVAGVPVEPAGRTLWQIALLSLLSGSVAGAMIAVMIEMKDRHIRSSTDLVDAVAVPVLGVLMWGPPRTALASASGLAQLWRRYGHGSWRV